MKHTGWVRGSLVVLLAGTLLGGVFWLSPDAEAPVPELPVAVAAYGLEVSPTVRRNPV